jgi:polyisoprenyl-phosphate glycosyltransferase
MRSPADANPRTLEALGCRIAARFERLAGPILVIGASGFVGANLLRRGLAVRRDIIGTVLSGPAWRLEGVSGANL